jgi:GDPmannose 4,6-dehydratase
LDNLKRLAIAQDVECLTMFPTDFRSTLQTLSRTKPDEVYNLAGQSSVGLSFELPVETIESIAIGTINLMEAIRFLGNGVRLYNASSSECFGDTDWKAASELTPFRPRSPYAVAKSAAHWAVVNYREAYGLFAANGILFNHESPFRHERFVTKKVIVSAFRIREDRSRKLRLGRLGVYRDWGWAPQYVEAMWRILQQPTPDDFVIATGHAYSLEDFVDTAFRELDLNWRDHIESDESEKRPSDISYSRGDPSKAATVLDWRPTYMMHDVVRMMVKAQLEESAGP